MCTFSIFTVKLFEVVLFAYVPNGKVIILHKRIEIRKIGRLEKYKEFSVIRIQGVCLYA